MISAPRTLFLGLLSAGLLLARPAMGVEAFVAPQAYPPSRYEPGWEKNPFTLKTAPVAVQKESFAKDWTLGGIGGRVSSPTVTVVNRQTHERVSLHGEEAAKNGMKLKAVHNQPSPRDSSVEVEQGAEVATLAYDETFLKTLSASAASAKGPAAPGGINGLPTGMSPGGPGLIHPSPAAPHMPNGMTATPTSIAPPPIPRAGGTPGAQNFSNPSSGPSTLQRRRYSTLPTPPTH